MSATSRPSPIAPEPQEQLYPPTAAPTPPSNPRAWKLILGVIGLVVVGAVVYQLWVRNQEATNAPVAPTIRTATISSGTFERNLRIAGQTSARRFANVVVPIMRGGRTELTLSQLAPPGSTVREGEIVAQIDSRALMDRLDDARDAYEQAQIDVKRRVADQTVTWENLQQTLRVAKANWDRAVLDAKAGELKTEIQRELERIAVEEAEARYKQNEADLPTLKERLRADLRILEIIHLRQASQRARLASDLERFTFRAKMPGLVVMQQVNRSGEMAQIQIGDNVNPGQLIMKIVDTQSMQVEASVNQAEAANLRIGQVAKIGLDAFPGLSFTGKIYSVGALAVQAGPRESAYLRTVPIRVAIDGQNPRMIPDLSAWADIRLERQENALLVPLGAVHSENGSKIVYVNRDGKFQKQQVELGSQNEIQAVVLAGLNAGDIVALDKPSVAQAGQ